MPGHRTRFLATLVLFILATPASAQPASAECDRQVAVAFNQTLTEIAEKTERFRAGNKEAFDKIFDARAKSGKYDDAANSKLIDELKRRMLEVHSGMPRQNAAIVDFKKDLAIARETGNCTAAKRATDVWLVETRTRNAEYDRYFEFLDGLVKEANEPKSR